MKRRSRPHRKRPTGDPARNSPFFLLTRAAQKCFAGAGWFSSVEETILNRRSLTGVRSEEGCFADQGGRLLRLPWSARLDLQIRPVAPSLKGLHSQAALERRTIRSLGFWRSGRIRL